MKQKKFLIEIQNFGADDTFRIEDDLFILNYLKKSTYPANVATLTQGNIFLIKNKPYRYLKDEKPMMCDFFQSTTNGTRVFPKKIKVKRISNND